MLEWIVTGQRVFASEQRETCRRAGGLWWCGSGYGSAAEVPGVHGPSRFRFSWPATAGNCLMILWLLWISSQQALCP